MIQIFIEVDSYDFRKYFQLNEWEIFIARILCQVLSRFSYQQIYQEEAKRGKVLTSNEKNCKGINFLFIWCRLWRFELLKLFAQHKHSILISCVGRNMIFTSKFLLLPGAKSFTSKGIS